LSPRLAEATIAYRNICPPGAVSERRKTQVRPRRKLAIAPQTAPTAVPNTAFARQSSTTMTIAVKSTADATTDPVW
jgi:hypothetical protein